MGFFDSIFVDLKIKVDKGRGGGTLILSFKKEYFVYRYEDNVPFC